MNLDSLDPQNTPLSSPASSLSTAAAAAAFSSPTAVHSSPVHSGHVNLVRERDTRFYHDHFMFAYCPKTASAAAPTLVLATGRAGTAFPRLGLWRRETQGAGAGQPGVDSPHNRLQSYLAPDQLLIMITLRKLPISQIRAVLHGPELVSRLQQQHGLKPQKKGQNVLR